MQFQLNLYFISIFEILKKTENKNDLEINSNEKTNRQAKIIFPKKIN